LHSPPLPSPSPPSPCSHAALPPPRRHGMAGGVGFCSFGCWQLAQSVTLCHPFCDFRIISRCQFKLFNFQVLKAQFCCFGPVRATVRLPVTDSKLNLSLEFQTKSRNMKSGVQIPDSWNGGRFRQQRRYKLQRNNKTNLHDNSFLPKNESQSNCHISGTNCTLKL
jgi:hypothetical protein